MDFLPGKHPYVPQVNPTWSWWLVCSCPILRKANRKRLKIFTSTFLSKSEHKISFFVTSLSNVAIDVILVLLSISGAAPLLLNVLGPFLHLGTPQCPPWGDYFGQASCFCWTQVSGRVPMKDALMGARAPFPAERRRLCPTESLLSLKTV